MQADTLPKAGDTVVRRTFAADKLQDDLFGIYHDGEWLADVSYQTARAYWLGRVTLVEILGVDHD